MKMRILASMLAVALAAAMIGGATMAWFTDTKTSPMNTFTAGTLKLDINESGIDGNSFTIDFGQVGAFQPGYVLPQWASVEIINGGSLDLVWFGKMLFSAPEWLTETWLNNIYIADAKMEFISPDGGHVWTEPTDVFITNGKASGAHAVGIKPLECPIYKVVTLKKWLANNQMGVAPYENTGAMRPGYGYRFSFRLGFIGGNHDQNVLQGQTFSIGYKVDATQYNVEALKAYGGHLNMGLYSAAINGQQP